MRPSSTSPHLLALLALVPLAAAQSPIPIAQQCAIVSSLTKTVTIPTESIDACCTFRQNLTVADNNIYQLAVVCDSKWSAITGLYLGGVEMGSLTGGGMPWSVWSQLPELLNLTVYNNSFTGSVEWPNFLKLPKLRRLDLSNNTLTGTIDITNMRGLTELYLTFNQFSGTIPDISIAQGLQKL
ncbi:hypothetical protein HK101_001446 [Irineochytrium annulatum]|nr:hypothetical protein HK101_001446 [Irineochytrium annulatum]